MKVLIVGHSHMHCVSAALDEDRAALAARGLHFETIQLREERFLQDPTGPGWAVGQRLRDEIADLGADCDFSLLMVAGNVHTQLGLMEFDPPFDFVLDEEPDLPLDPYRTLVPAALVAARMARLDFLVGAIAQRRLLLPLLPPPLGQTDSPPPIGDDGFVWAGLLDVHRRSERFRHGLAPAHLRYKIWRLHGRLLAQECRQLGLPLLPVPADARDERGYLAPEAWGPDAVHAGTWYGRQVLLQAVQARELRQAA